MQIFLSFFFRQLVIITWLSENKFTFHPHFKNIYDNIASVVGDPQYY